jgi:hypothetical protein
MAELGRSHGVNFQIVYKIKAIFDQYRRRTAGRSDDVGDSQKSQSAEKTGFLKRNGQKGRTF